MGRFNLLDEPWISVILDLKGNSKDVSLKELFENAHNYRRLGGESKTQDFAVFRIILAVMHTVFSRFDDEGNEYGYFNLSDKYRQLSKIYDEDELDEYNNRLFETWINLWNADQFPSVLGEYLNKWYDRFYLFDEKYPFFQVVKKDISEEKISKKDPSIVYGKNINRLISESANKFSLFSPRYNRGNNKEILTEPEIARWLLTLHGYTGLSDKVIFGKEKYKSSKGWLFDIGGIYLEGDNLKQSLLLNCALVHPEKKYHSSIQKPCWELSSKERIDEIFSSTELDNLSSLYTNWSRGIYIDPNTDSSKPFSLEIVKLPDINHKDQFLELMTLWRFNKDGENKDSFTPRKHQLNESMWRSFGLISLDNRQDKENSRHSGIVDWLSSIQQILGEVKVQFNGVSMQDDGNATSWVPTDEIVDSLNIFNILVTDVTEEGWVPRIIDAVEQIKKVINKDYRQFIIDLNKIRNTSSNNLVNRYIEEIYFIIDEPFRNWISEIKPPDLKDRKIFEWRAKFKKLILEQSKKIVNQSGPRDFIGIIDNGKVKNIATIYDEFSHSLNKELIIKEVNNFETK